MKKILLIAVMTIGFSVATTTKANAKSFWKSFIEWMTEKRRERPQGSHD